MKKLFLLIAILAVGSISAQGNGDFVSFQFVKTTPGEQYNVILNEKWKELHQMRIDEGTITGWDPAEKRGGRGACPDKYCGYEPNQMDGMDPSQRAAYTPMSDTRFPDLMPPAWQNNGYSQGTGSAAFLTGSNWGIYEGRMVAGIMGIAFGDTPGGSRIDIMDIADNGLSMKSVIHMPVGMTERFRGLVMGPDNPPPTTITRCLLINIALVTRLQPTRKRRLQLKK